MLREHLYVNTPKLVTAWALAATLTLAGCASTHVLKDFTTDGCSVFPDGTALQPKLWCDCCVTHDQAYWRGGSAEQRLRADAALGACVRAATGKVTLANWMVRGVRVSGMPLLPTAFRWGYGWGYGRGYAPLSPDEQQQADKKLAEYQRLHPQACCKND